MLIININYNLYPNGCNYYLFRFSRDRRLNKRKFIDVNKQQIKFPFQKLNWIVGSHPMLSFDIKIKPIRLYSSQLWGTARLFADYIIQKTQSKILWGITCGPNDIRNENFYFFDNLRFWYHCQCIDQCNNGTQLYVKHLTIMDFMISWWISNTINAKKI